jgi:hypothetical protein
MIIGAAVRESVLAPNAVVDPVRSRRSVIGMVIAVGVLTFALWRGNAWWGHVDAEFRSNRLFKPIEVPTSVKKEGNRAILIVRANPSDRDWRDQTPLVADHGKLMHLFLIKNDDMGSFAHLHPVKVDEDRFEATLPPLSAGDYSVYAEVTHESGLARTLVSKATLPEIFSATGMADEDDSWWPNEQRGVSVRQLGSEPLVARKEVVLRFDALAADGQPAPLEPYMGMWSHAVIRASDGTVFTHLHPSGTISMTAQELFARRERGEDLKKPIDVMCGRPERELRFPYSFPKAGKYRMWVQVRAAGNVVTKEFDFEVLPPKRNDQLP